MLGATTVAVEVTGPRDVFDFRVWRAIPRSDVRSATIAMNRVDLGGIGHVFAGTDKLSGVADGEIAMKPDGVHGSIRVHGVKIKPARRRRRDRHHRSGERGDSRRPRS
jgi:hypothetical protein